MPVDTAPVGATAMRSGCAPPALAAAHTCVWCRSRRVTAVLAFAGTTTEDPGRGAAVAQCRDCGQDGPLVPAGFRC